MVTLTTVQEGVMAIEFSDEQVEFRDVLHDFADRQLEPRVEAWEAAGELPLEAVTEMAELGLFGLVFPAEWGGSGADFTTLCIAIEEIGRVSQSLGITLSAGVGLGANPIHRFGTDEQKDRWLPDLVAGRRLGAFGLTEPDAGSDAGRTRTRARLDPHAGEWVIDGSKAFITNCGTPITSVVTVTARTDEGISAFVVPAGTPGLIVEPAYRKLGWHASDTHGLVLDGCRVPEANMLGAPGQGFRNFLSILDDGRIAIAALALGCARRCLEDALAYAGQRQAFGGPIGRNQGLAFPLADLAVAVENSRNLVYAAARRKDRGRDITRAAAMAKLYATETAVDAARLATQVFGGAGFIEETAVVRFYRDAKILEVGEGTSEIQRLVIARSLGLPVA
jgi:short-chain 2-methylacyl-CoA dehydrogenase